MTTPKSLPVRPSLESLRKHAKKLARERAVSLRDAQLVIACTPPSARAIPAQEIARVAEAFGVPAEVVPDVGNAVDRARDIATRDDAILVGGSLYVVGAARTHLGL